MSVCPQGGVCPIACWDTDPPRTRGRHPSPPGQTSPRQTPPGQTPPLSRHPLVQCMLGYGQRAGGTHPTGMHSFYIKISRFQFETPLSWLQYANIFLFIWSVKSFSFFTLFDFWFEPSICGFMEVQRRAPWPNFLRFMQFLGKIGRTRDKWAKQKNVVVLFLSASTLSKTWLSQMNPPISDQETVCNDFSAIIFNLKLPRSVSRCLSIYIV